MVCFVMPAGCPHADDTGIEGTGLWSLLTSQAKHATWVGILGFRSVPNYLLMSTENILAVLYKDVFLYNYCYSCGRWVGQKNDLQTNRWLKCSKGPNP